MNLRRISLKALIAITLCVITSCAAFAPASNFQGVLDEKLATIEGKYQVSDDGVYIQKVIESTGNKDKIYVKLLEFLTRTYNDADEVIQVKEKRMV